MSATVLAARIALFQALCKDITEKAGRGALRVNDVDALCDDLLAISKDTSISPYARGLMNQAYARTDAVERYLNMDDPPRVSPLLEYTIRALCETLGHLKAKLESPI